MSIGKPYLGNIPFALKKLIEAWSSNVAISFSAAIALPNPFTALPSLSNAPRTSKENFFSPSMSALLSSIARVSEPSSPVKSLINFHPSTSRLLHISSGNASCMLLRRSSGFSDSALFKSSIIFLVPL